MNATTLTAATEIMMSSGDAELLNDALEIHRGGLTLPRLRRRCAQRNDDFEMFKWTARLPAP